MKILRKSDLSGQKSKPFMAAVADLAGKDNGASVRIYEKKGLKGKYLAEIPISDAVDLSRNFEEVLKEEFGGGEYEVMLCNGNTEVKAKHHFSIAGTSKSKSQSQDDDSKRKRTAGTSDREMLTAVMVKLADAAISNKSSSADEWQRTLELAKALKGDGSDKEFQREMFSVLYNNAMSSKEDAFDNAMRVIEMSRAMQPNIEKEDPFTALIGSVGPALAQIFAARMSGSSPSLSNQQIQELNQNLGMLKEQVALLPPPGETPQAQAQVNPAPMSGTEGSQEKQTDKTDELRSILNKLLSIFRKNVAQGTEAGKLADELLTLVNTARVWGAESAPAELEGLLSADPNNASALIEEFRKFCAEIPELQKNQQLQLELGQQLAIRLAWLDSINDDEEEEDGQGQTVEPAPAEVEATVNSEQSDDA